MTLVVRAPASYEAERRYALGVVLGERLGLDWSLSIQERTGFSIVSDDGSDGREVTLPDILFATAPVRWLTEAALPRPPLPRRPVGAAGSDVLHPHELLPVVYGTASGSCLLDVDEPGAALNVDVFGSAFALLTRYEEAVSGERDSYDRFPASASLAAREDFLGLPVVDAYVELLWTALVRVWPRLRRRRRAYEVLLTHDVDDPLAILGRSPIGIARQFAADVVLRRDLGLAGRRARALVVPRADHAFDPHNTFDFLMDVSERHGLSSAFYLQAHRGSDVGAAATYALDHPWIHALIRSVRNRGHELGYHAGFGTYLDPSRTAAEFEHLRTVAASEGVHQDRWGGRQHYLQWAVPTTWRNWDAAGLDYDCTVAYADAVGFRTGTCHEFPVFDLATRRPLDLRERPFQVMDVTLFGRMSLSPGGAAEAVHRIAAECRRYSGSLGILWHNNSLRTGREKRWYAELVASVTAPP